MQIEFLKEIDMKLNFLRCSLAFFFVKSHFSSYEKTSTEGILQSYNHTQVTIEW